MKLKKLQEKFNSAKELEVIKVDFAKEKRFILEPLASVQEWENFYPNINHTISDWMVYKLDTRKKELQDCYVLDCDGMVLSSNSKATTVYTVKSFTVYKPVERW